MTFYIKAEHPTMKTTWLSDDGNLYRDESRARAFANRDEAEKLAAQKTRISTTGRVFSVVEGELPSGSPVPPFD